MRVPDYWVIPLVETGYELNFLCDGASLRWRIFAMAHRCDGASLRWRIFAMAHRSSPEEAVPTHALARASLFRDMR
jgi:hypothetical protein